MRPVLGLLSLCILFGCGGGGGGNFPAPPPSAPSILSFTATPGTINQGQGSLLAWTVSGAANLSIDQGIGTVTGSSVNVRPANTTTYVLTATNPGGSTTASATVTVNPAPSFSLSLNPTSFTVAAGASGNTTVNVLPTGGFTGAVTFSLTGAPSGVIASFAPNSSATSSTLSLQVPASALPGTYPLVVQGTASGLSEATANLSLTVTSGGPVGTSIAWELCIPFQTVLWFAAQDGNGPWQVVQPVNGRYAFNVASGKAGVAMVLDGGSLKTLNLFYGTTAELQQSSAAVSIMNFLGCDPLATASGSVSGQDSVTDYVPLGLGEAQTMLSPGQSSFNLSMVKPGVKDLLASANWLDGSNPLAPVWRTRKIILRRGISVPQGGLPGLSLNFNAEGFAPEVRSATIQGLGAGEIAVGMGCFYSTQGLFAGYTAQGNTNLLLGNGQSYPFAGIPPAQQQASDVHGLGVVAAPLAGPTYSPDNTRSITKFFRAPVDQVLAIPGAHPLPTVQKVAGTPYLRSQVDWTVTAPFNKIWSYSGIQGSPTPTRSYSVYLTAGYAGGATSLSHTLPDFTGLAGWNPIWAPANNTALVVGFNAGGWTSTTSTLAPARVDGETYSTAYRQLVFNP